MSNKVKWSELSTFEQFEEVLASGNAPKPDDRQGQKDLQTRVSQLVSVNKLSSKQGTEILQAASGIGGDLQKQIDKNRPLSEQAEADNRGKIVFPFPREAGFPLSGFGATENQWKALIELVKSGECEKGVARVVKENPNLKGVYEMSRAMQAGRRNQRAASRRDD